MEGFFNDKSCGCATVTLCNKSPSHSYEFCSSIGVLVTLTMLSSDMPRSYFSVLASKCTIKSFADRLELNFDFECQEDLAPSPGPS